MAYRLDRDESVPQGLKRIVRERLSTAVDELGKHGRQRAVGIHEARKSIKKVRALLRLVRLELGDIYQRENSTLRRIGRKLSTFRDATAMIQIVDALKERHPEESALRSLRSIRRKLVARRAAAERQKNVTGLFQKMAATLRGIESRVTFWPLETDGFVAIAPGLESTYRAGRKALATAQKQPRPENYHEWRKRLKDHWYHVRLLENLWSDVMVGYERSLKNLETWLGDDHNLVVLRETIQRTPDRFGDSKDIDTLFDLIAKYQKELRENSVALGQRIYEEKPKLFTQRMKHLWDAWLSEPKSLERFEKRQKRPPGKVA